MRSSGNCDHGLVRGILIGLWLFIQLLQAERIRDNNQEQEQNNYQQEWKKREPEENDDNCSWQGNFDWSEEYSVGLTGKLAEIKILRKQNIIYKLYK